jgi:hypothetical protein
MCDIMSGCRTIEMRWTPFFLSDTKTLRVRAAKCHQRLAAAELANGRG